MPEAAIVAFRGLSRLTTPAPKVQLLVVSSMFPVVPTWTHPLEVAPRVTMLAMWFVVPPLSPIREALKLTLMLLLPPVTRRKTFRWLSPLWF